MEVTGIIMAGGKSSRMGKDKGLMTYAGKPLVTYPLEILKNTCNEILISTNSDEYMNFGFPLVKDEIKEIGPIGGLYSSLRISTNDWNLVLACDMPFVSNVFLNYLISEIDKGYDAVVPQNENAQFEALCAVYSKTCISCIGQRIESREYGLYQLLNGLKIKKLPVSENNRNFINLNTLDEFKKAENEIY